MVTITDILNQWADFGVFAYVLPTLLIFALVFGILGSTKVLGKNRGVNAVISLVMALLALQSDFVSNFFAEIFPYAGIGISFLLLAIIFMGMIGQDDDKSYRWIVFGVGALIFIIIAVYMMYDYDWLGSYSGENYWPVIVTLLLVGGGIAAVMVGSKEKDKTPGPARS
jgi:ABC-type transport system involved in cytochrome c biogenesis permease subunit